jgi:hypothetical protein
VSSSNLTIAESEPVEAGATFSAIKCGVCGATFRILLPVFINDLVAITGALIERHSHDGSEKDDE